MGVRVSVAMVTFNGEDFLREQLESILDQDPPPDELVIGDDGSTDRTIDLIREATRDTRIPIIVVGGDHVGLRLNVQRTIEACTGDVIALADQDDIWMPGKIAAIREAFRDPSVTLWFSDADLIDETGRLMGESLWERLEIAPWQSRDIEEGRGLRRLLGGATVTGATMAFAASVSDVALRFPDELDGDDHLFMHDGWIAVLASICGATIADPISRIRYRRHPRQVTAASESQQDAAPIASKTDLLRQHARIELVLARLTDAGALDAGSQDQARELLEVEQLFRVRALPRGVMRVGSIIRQFALGRYSQYARGWRTAAADLFLTRD